MAYCPQIGNELAVDDNDLAGPPATDVRNKRQRGDDPMPQFMCETCGQQHAPREAPPPRCMICDDDRQFVPVTGQRWTTPEDLAARHSNMFRQLAPGLIAISTVPHFGIGQRALLVQTPSGNVLWDCISLLDEATISIIRALGGAFPCSMPRPSP